MKLRSAVCLLLLHCAGTEAVRAVGDEPLQFTIDGNARFACALFKEVARVHPGNLILSPWSVSCALVPARAGARGATAAEISRAAFLSASDDALRDSFGFIRRQLDELNRDDARELRQTTAIFCHQRQPLKDSFVRFCEASVGAKVMDAPFDTMAMNDWIQRETGGQIQNMIEPGQLTPLSRLVLINTLTFKGRWRRKFAVSATRPGLFKPASDRTVEVPMMRGEHSAGHAVYRGTRALRLVYEGGGVWMLILLPLEDTPLREIEQDLSVEWLRGCYDSLKPATVDITLPRFTLENSLMLKSGLQQLGMRKSFDEREADFSGIDEEPDSLWIEDVLHRARCEVNEEGTKAAAATVSVYGRGGLLPVSFHCDRPFLLVIHAMKAGTILFMGRVADPSVIPMNGPWKGRP